MKRSFFFLALMLGVSAVMSQSGYQFQMLTEEYSEFSNGVSLTNGDYWDDIDEDIQLGFPFELFGMPVNQLYAPGMGTEIYYEDEYDYFIMITPFYADLVDPCYDDEDYDDGDWKKIGSHRNPCSDISYVVEGNPGNRIFKMQWSNAGFWNPDYLSVNPDYYINMQVWMYESDNVIEFRYGPSFITDQFQQDLINEEGINFLSVLMFENDEGEFVASINGNPANPTFMAGLLDTIPEDDFEDFGLLRFPAANTVYRLTPSTSGIHSYADMNVSVYPNPVSDLMTINGADNALVQIFDVNGKLLVSEVYNQPISVSELPSGLYMVKITTDQGSVVKKIVK